jgi:hypothetical protein
MGHEVGDPFEHALWFQNERRQGDSCQVHARTKLRDHAQQDVLQGHDLVECFIDGNKLGSNLVLVLQLLNIFTFILLFGGTWTRY